MKLAYDAETDTLTIVLREVPVAESTEEPSGAILDYDAEGRPVGLEILDPSERVDAVDTVELKVGGRAHAAAAE